MNHFQSSYGALLCSGRIIITNIPTSYLKVVFSCSIQRKQIVRCKVGIFISSRLGHCLNFTLAEERQNVSLVICAQFGLHPWFVGKFSEQFNKQGEFRFNNTFLRFNIALYQGKSSTRFLYTNIALKFLIGR